MIVVNDFGRSPDGSGHSRAEPEEVSVVPTSVPNAVLSAIFGEAVAGYGRKCRVCGSTSSLEQLNRYWHYEADEEGEYVVWLPGRYCSRVCMAVSPSIDWKRAASAIEAQRAATSSGAVHESAVAATSGETPTPDHLHHSSTTPGSGEEQ